MVSGILTIWIMIIYDFMILKKNWSLGCGLNMCFHFQKGTSIQKWSHCESNKRDLTCKNRCFEIYVLVSKFGFEASPSVGVPDRLSWERHSCRGAEEIFKVQPGTGSRSKMSAPNQSTSKTATHSCKRYMINLDSLIFVVATIKNAPSP